jgi:hypothetical protein
MQYIVYGAVLLRCFKLRKEKELSERHDEFTTAVAGCVRKSYAN